MVVTIEPGIYIPEENLGARIEDDVLITESGYQLLSDRLPRDPDEIERVMAAARERREREETGGDAEALDNDVEGEKIRELIAKYARSVDNADTTLAAEVWSNSADVSFINPMGHEHGWENVKRNVYERMLGDVFSERKLSVRDVSVHVYGDAAWAEFYWRFEAKLRSDGSAVTTAGRETQIYRKSDPRGWALVHVHYSGMPVKGER
jgi:ketosteroid isomerase-like protein